MMKITTEFQALIDQLTYLDHEHDTDFAGELAGVIAQARSEGLSTNEIVELAQEAVKFMQFEHSEQADIIETIIEQLPDVLA